MARLFPLDFYVTVDKAFCLIILNLIAILSSACVNSTSFKFESTPVSLNNTQPDYSSGNETWCINLSLLKRLTDLLKTHWAISINTCISHLLMHFEFYHLWRVTFLPTKEVPPFPHILSISISGRCANKKWNGPFEWLWYLSVADQRIVLFWYMITVNQFNLQRGISAWSRLTWCIASDEA